MLGLMLGSALQRPYETSSDPYKPPGTAQVMEEESQRSGIPKGIEPGHCTRTWLLIQVTPQLGALHHL